VVKISIVGVSASLNGNIEPTIYEIAQAQRDSATSFSPHRSAVLGIYVVVVAAAVVDKPEEELRSGVDRLIHAGLLFQQGVPPRATYLFKHTLVQDAAYGTLLRETRRDLHSRIGTKLEEIFPDVAEAQPDLLAHHFAEGGLSQKAISYWAKAGKQAVSRAMMSEGLSYLNKGLSLLSSMPDNAWRREHELTLQIAIGSALIATSGPAARSVGEAYERAEQLWENLGRPPHFEPKLALFWHQFARGELGTATETAKELIQIGGTRNDVAVKFIGHLYLADVCLDRGDFVEAREHAEHSLALFEPTSVSRRFLPNGQVAALASLSLSRFWLGYPDQARLTMDQALLEAHRPAHPYTLATALLGALRIEWALGSTHKLLDRAEEIIALGFDTVGQAPMFRDWCLSVSRED
jgi:tetratricopeptide (TPR) repeat protein